MFLGIEIDGLLLVDESLADNISITAIDSAAPSITTDGGTWSTTPFDTTDAAIMNELTSNGRGGDSVLLRRLSRVPMVGFLIVLQP